MDNLVYDKKNTWEKVDKGLVKGKLDTKNDTNYIVVFDEKEREIGRIIIDSFTDYSEFYKNKLSLFDTFWFYINIKDTIEWKTRRRTREMFHADVVMAGLF